MTLDQKLEQAKKLLEQIQKVYDELGKTNPFQGMDPNTVALSNKEIDKLEIALTGITKKANDLEKGFGGIAKSIGASLAEMTQQSSATNRTVKAMRSLSSISESLKHDQSGLSKLSLKELESKRDKAKILSQEAKSQAALVKQKYDEITLDKNGNQLQGDELNAKLKSLGISKSELQTMNEIVAAHEAKFPVLDKLNAKIEERIQKEKKVNKTLGLTKVALEGLGKIPIVGPLLDTNKALDAARTKAEAGGGAFASMGAAIGSMSKSLVSGLTDPLFLVGLLVKGFQMFLDIGFETDKQITDLSKSMSVSKEEATSVRNRFIEIADEAANSANEGERLLVTQKNLVEAQLELASAFGVTRGFTEQQIKSQIILTKQMGLTAEEAGGIQQLAMANGKTAKDVTSTIVKQTQALAKQTGIQLNNKEVVQDVAKVSGQLRLQYANNPKLIAKAVVETKKLGINMEIAANAAKGLLDFESSIENELSAELLTGKALNLERARGLALNGDSVGAAKEMLAQVGSAADFQNMNVIQQEAIAKAVGMSTDDLANSLVIQENLKKLGDNTKKQIEEKAQKLRDEGKIDEANALLRKAFSDEAAEAALTEISAQDRFNLTIEKLKSMLSSIVEGPAAEFVEYLTQATDKTNGMNSPLTTMFNTIKGIVEFVKEWGSTLATIAKLYVVIKAAQIGYNIALGVAALLNKQSIKDTKKEGLIQATSTAFKVGGTMGPAAIAAIPIMIAAGIAAFAMFNKGGSVPGTNTKSDSVPALLTSGEYVIPNSNGKTGTEKYNEMISTSSPTMLNEGGKVSINPNKNTGTNSSNNIDLSPLIAAINGLKSDMKVLASRPINTSVQLDGKELVLAQGTYSKEKGDANRMESWQMS
jgi:hypothetical protein